jgi:hypothetical protein
MNEYFVTKAHTMRTIYILLYIEISLHILEIIIDLSQFKGIFK